MNTTIPITMTLPRGLVARLDQVAEADDRGRSATVRRILDAALSGSRAPHAPAAITGWRLGAVPPPVRGTPAGLVAARCRKERNHESR